MLNLCVINVNVIRKKNININKKVKNKRTFYNYVKYMLIQKLNCVNAKNFINLRFKVYTKYMLSVMSIFIKCYNFFIVFNIYNINN